MAYKLRYKLEFDDIHVATPASWRVEILRRDDDGVDGVYQLTGSDSPLMITKGDQSDDKFQSILGTEVKIGITINDDIPSGAAPFFIRPVEPTDFFTVDETELRVDIYKDDVLKGVYFCKPDYCEYSYTAKPYYFTIIATDRIKLLDSTLVDIAAAKDGDGYISILDLLTSNGLYNTLTCEEIKVINSVRYKTETSTLVNKKVRYELLVDDNGNAITVFESIKRIAESFGCRIFYEDGSFWMQRIEDLATETCKVFTYTDSETPTISNLAIRKIIKGEISSSDAIYVNNNINIRIGPGHKQEMQDVDYRFRGWLQNFNWSEWDGSNFDHWVKNSHATIARHGAGTLEDPYTLFFQKNSGDTGVLWQVIDGVPLGALISLQTKIKFLKTQRTAFRFYICDTATGAQDPSDDSLKRLVYLQDHWGNAGDNLGSPGNIFFERNDNGDASVNIDLPRWLLEDNGVPYDPDHTFSLLIYILDPDGNFTENSPYTGMEVSEIILNLRSNNYTGEINTIRLNKNYSFLNEVEKAVFIDGNVYIANTIYNDTTPTESTWQSDYLPLATRFQSLNLYSRINVYSKPYKILTGAFYSNIISFKNVLQQAYGEYSLFIQMYDEYDVRKCLHNMRLAEINHGAMNLSNIESSTTKYKH